MSDAVEWRPVVGFEGKYEVSSLGQVRSLVFINGTGSRPRHEPLLLKHRLDSAGRPGLHLCRDGQTETHLVAHLVLLSFIGPRPADKHHAAHGDGDQTNNRLANLRWATRVENEADKVLHGTALRGERNHRARLTNADALDIRRALWDGDTAAGLAARYGVGETTILDIGKHRTFRGLPDSPPPTPRYSRPSGRRGVSALGNPAAILELTLEGSHADPA